MSKWIGYETEKRLWDEPGLRLVPKESREAVAAGFGRRLRAYPLIVTGICLGVIVILAGWLQAVSSEAVQVFGVVCVGFPLVAFGLKVVLSPGTEEEDRIREYLRRRPCWQCGCSLLGREDAYCPECGSKVDVAIYEAIEKDLQTGVSSSATDCEDASCDPVQSVIPEAGRTMLERKWRSSNAGCSSRARGRLLPLLFGGGGAMLSLGIQGSAMEEQERNRRLRFFHDALAMRPCWDCGHPLVNLESGHCPKCNRPFDVAEYEAIEAEMAESRRNQS